MPSTTNKSDSNLLIALRFKRLTPGARLQRDNRRHVFRVTPQSSTNSFCRPQWPTPSQFFPRTTETRLARLSSPLNRNTLDVRGGNHPPVQWPDSITKWLSWSKQPAGASRRVAKRDKKRPAKLTARLYRT